MTNESKSKKEDFGGFGTLAEFKNAKRKFFIIISIVFAVLLLAFSEFYSTLSHSNQILNIEKNIASSSKSWINEKGDVAVNTIQGYNKCVDGSEKGVKLSRSDCLKLAGEEFSKIVRDAVEKSDASDSIKNSYMTTSD